MNKKLKRKRISEKNQNIADPDESPIKKVCTRSMNHSAQEPGPIYKLNNDCLRQIFSYLSKRELIGIERVCKKWKEISLSVWSSETLLNSEKIKNITNVDRDIDIKKLKSILMRCGKYIESFQLSGCYFFDDRKTIADPIVHLICKHCEILKHLDLTNIIVTRSGFQKLENELASNLESFAIRCVEISYPFQRLISKRLNDILYDDRFETFLKQAPKLDKLSIIANNDITGNGLVNSKKAFKKLDLRFCKEIKDEALNKVLDNSPELQIFKCTAGCRFSMFYERPLREHLVVLKTQNSSFFKGVPESSIQFPNLCVLRFSLDYSINNQVLSKFYEWFPNLETLCLRLIESRDNCDSETLNDDGFKKLAKIPKLKSLHLDSIQRLSGEALVFIAANHGGKLEKVKLESLPKLRGPELVKFVTLCPDLKNLIVYRCEQVETGNFLDEVLKSMDLRPSKELLTINTWLRQCDVQKYNNKHPLLFVK